jgi:hypothetical protein
MASMNIKNTAAHRMATELSRLRGVSVTQAVADAVRHELEREKGRQGRLGLAAELVEIGQRCAARMRRRTSSSSHERLLYNRAGLPR